MKYKLLKPLPGIEVGTIYDEVKDITLATTMDKVRLSQFVDLFGTNNDFFEPVQELSKL